MRIIVAIIFVILFITNSYSQNSYSQNCKLANRYIFEFDFSGARNILGKEIKENPSNIIVYYLENYIEFIEVIINGGDDRYEIYKDNFYDRLKEIKTSNQNDPFYLFVLSEMYLHTALLNGHFQEFIKSGISFYRSYKYTNENIELYPEFIYNKKIKGIHELMMTIIPEEYESLFAFFGFKGTSENSLKYLDEYFQFAKKISELEPEAAMFKFFVLAQFGEDVFAPINFLDSQNYRNSSNIVLNISYIFAVKHSYNTDGSLAFFYEKKDDFLKHNIPQLNYLIGSLKFTHLDENANIYFENFLKYYKGEHFVKHASRKLAWYYFIHDDKDKFTYYTEKTLYEGVTTLEHDIQAEHEMKDTIGFSKTLIKARLLVDGGYYKRALELLSKNSNEFKKCPLKNQVEYFYWYGRIYYSLNKNEKAKKYFNYTLKYGAELSDYYFVGEAAYYCGLVLENEGDTEDAKKYFKRSITLLNSKYYPTTVRRAKIALDRVD